MHLVTKDELQNVGIEFRVEIAKKVGRLLCSDDPKKDYDAAIELAHFLTEDVSIAVRKALSTQLRNSRYLPTNIVEKLANDIEQVSQPFLMKSQAVDDAFLKEFLGKCDSALQEAVAKRDDVSEELTYAICDVASVEAVSTLMSNEGAHLNEGSATRVVDRFPEEMPLLECMAQRSDLPVAVVECLIFKISSKYGEYLAKKFALTTDYSEYIISLAGRQVFHETLEVSPDFEVYNYFTQLHKEKALTSDLLFGYIQSGYVKVFIVALAVRADMQPKSLWAAIETDSSKVLDKLLRKCNFSRTVIGAILVAFERQQPQKV